MVLLLAAERVRVETGDALLFVGDDWAEDHHDVELMDATGRGWPRPLPEGVEESPGCTR